MPTAVGQSKTATGSYLATEIKGCSALASATLAMNCFERNCDATGIPMITLLSVVLATLIPKQLEPLASSGEGIAAILLSLFFAAVGKFF